VLDDGVDLLLLNRQLDYGFDEREGVALIRSCARTTRREDDARQQLPRGPGGGGGRGALPGFGKREIGTPKVNELLRNALRQEQPQV
jgi:hypothetical protein